MKANTLSVHSVQQYQDDLSVDASVSGGAFFWSFSASTNFQNAAQSLLAQTKTQYQTTASCNVYLAKVLSDCTLPLTDPFRRAVANLPVFLDYQKYLKFITVYGTHFTSSAFMGAKFTYTEEFNSQDVQTMSSRGVNVAAGVSVQAIVAKAKIGVQVDWHKSDYQNVSKFLSEKSTIVVGNLPPERFPCTDLSARRIKST